MDSIPPAQQKRHTNAEEDDADEDEIISGYPKPVAQPPYHPVPQFCTSYEVYRLPDDEIEHRIEHPKSEK